MAMALTASGVIGNVGVVPNGIHASPFRVGDSSFRLISRSVARKYSSSIVVAKGLGFPEADDEAQAGCPGDVSRRGLLLAGLFTSCGVGMTGATPKATAGVQAYRKFVDRLDGYAFSYPSAWIQVRGAGADVFFRDPVNLDENLLVEMSSPSSSRFKGVEDLGTPEQAAQRVLQQQLTEFMSTRIGVRREASVTGARARQGEDGRLYYEVEVTASSYANNNQLAVMPGDRIAQLEWSRRYLSVLGVENSRLYQLRLQVPEKVADLEQQDLRRIMESFKVLKLEA